MNSNRGRCVAVTLGAAAAALVGAGMAHAVPDFQVSVDGIDLFPTAGNAAIAESTLGNMAIASGVGANANASDGFGNIADATGTDADALAGQTSTSFFDSAWASGDHTISNALGGIANTAISSGTGSGAGAGLGNNSFDLAVASSGDTALADKGNFDVVFNPPLPAATDVPAADPAQALDMQISIGGTDLFPTAGNTATATSDSGDIAIAIGNGAHATAVSGIGDFAFADGANSIADAGAGIGGQSFDSAFDSALVFGSDSTAVAGDGFGQPSFFDLAAVFGDMLHAGALGIFGDVDILP